MEQRFVLTLILGAVLTVPVASWSAAAGGGRVDTEVEIVSSSEFVDPQERISGGAVSGVFLAGEGSDESLWIQGEQAQQLFVYVPAQVSELNVHIAAIDGRYLYTAAVGIECKEARWVLVPLTYRKLDQVRERQYTLNEIAALVTASDTPQRPCDRAEDTSKGLTALPATWGPVGSGSVPRVEYLLVQFKAGKFKATVANEERDANKDRCHGLAGSGRHAFKFDHVCTLAAGRPSDEIKIRTKRLGVRGDDIELTVPMPR